MKTGFPWDGWRRSVLSPDRPGRLWKLLVRVGVIRATGDPELVFPIPYSPCRVAVLAARIRLSRNIRRFDPADTGPLNEWAPEALVAPPEHALRLASLKLSGLAKTPSFSAAIVIMSPAGGPGLSEEDRDRLWNAFGVPVFEQLVGHDGRVIARECEVHDGLHLADGVVSNVELPGELVTAECECGSSAPRLKLAARMEVEAAEE